MLEVDLTSAARFLDALGGPGTPHTFQAFAEGASTAFPFHRHGTLAELADDLTKANRQLCGVSVTVNLTDGRGRTRENMLRPRALFLDIDGDDDKAPPLPSFPKAAWPSAVVRTRRGFHVYWWLDGSELGWEPWERAQGSLAAKFGGDPRMDDRTKALRVPGFWHHKTEPAVAIELAHLSTETPASFEALVSHLGLRLDEPARPATEPRGERPRWVLDAIEAMSGAERAEQYRTWVAKEPPSVEGHGGHSHLVRVIKMAWNFGVPWDDAWPVVEAFNDRCDPPWSTGALRSQFDSAARSRFDDSSWESQLWAPGRERVTRSGPELPDDVPLPENPDGARRVVTIDNGPTPDAIAPPLPDGEPIVVALGAGGGGEGRDGGDDDGLGWDGPPVNGHRILDKFSPLESAKIFLRWRHVRMGAKTLTLFRRAWYRWGSDRYQALSREKVNQMLYSFSAPAQTWVTTKKGDRILAPFNPDDTKVNKMRHALESLTFVDDEINPPCWIGPSKDPQPSPSEIVACANGLLHLPSGRFLGKRPDYFNLTALSVDHNPKAKPPHRWLRFLEELWTDDPQSHRLLQEWFGLCLVPDTSHQKALLIVGPKRSGKGTIARTLNALHGSHNSVAWPSLRDLVSPFGLSGLLDKTVAIMPDLRVSQRVDVQGAVERLLQITGEDRMQVDRKNQAMLQVKIPVRFMLLSNLSPRLPDAGGAFASRMLALNLEQSFYGREDRQLEHQLRAELEGILLWSIEGWKRLNARGYFEQSDTGTEVVDEVTRLSNPIQAFVEDRCQLDPEATTNTDDLFVAWRKWCEAENRSHPGEKSTFIRNVKAAFPMLRKSRPRNALGGRMHALEGIKIRERDEVVGAQTTLAERQFPD